MADEKTFTQADLDAAIEKAVGPLKSKLDEVMDEAKEAKRKLRAASEIKPEDLTAAEDRADKAEQALAEANKTLKTLTKERDDAVKSLETEQGAARTAFVEAELAAQANAIGVVPALADGFKALHRANLKAEVVDGRYVVTTADGKVPKDYFAEVAGSEAGKHWIAAPVNGGGGATGGDGKGGGSNPFAKDTMNMTEQAKLIRTDPTQAKALASAAGVELTI